MGDNIDNMIHIPPVTDERKPKIGMNFVSIEEAFSFYNQYAREAGFSARMGNSKRSKLTKEIVRKQLVCFKEGHTVEARSNKRGISGQPIKCRVRGEVRTDCKAKIALVKQQTGPNWSISKFVEGHNHALSTPSKVHLLRSHRSVSTAKKALTQQFSEANIPTCQQMRLLEIEYGGPANIGCTERDIRNFEKELRDKQNGIDADTLIEFFASEKEKNPAFFFDYETDSDNKFNMCFWADPTSRRAYSVFGDVVVLDSTYKTNKYEMIFAPFVGVNHHHQTIVFGCGFLSDEKTESYIWLINKMMEAMPTGAPKLIITDQDLAMTKAIAQVLPATVHRYCIWHILKKFPEKVCAMILRDHYKSIKRVISNSTSPDEFELSWKEVIKCANLEENEWLSSMYELRRSGFRHILIMFRAGMSSSQRAESTHAFFKRYISSKNSLMDFITRFNRAMRHQRHNELVADHNDMNERPKIKTNWPMEAQMAQVYTKAKWVEFQSEINQSHGYYVQHKSTLDELVFYDVISSLSSSASIPRLLTIDKEREYVSCSCRKFEFDGIPCRHMLSFFCINQVFQLHEKYILKRWTRDAKIGAVYAIDDQNISNTPLGSLMSRHFRLSYKASMLVDDASLTDEGTIFLDEQLDYMLRKIKEMNISPAYIERAQRITSLDKANNIKDPSEIRTKGCGKRLQSSMEKTTLKPRICHGCGQRGVAHDKRTAPYCMTSQIRVIIRITMIMQMNKTVAGDDGLSSCASGTILAALTR